MDTYLAIAEKVLREVRRPLSALEILQTAYRIGVAPPHLTGRTQHKTMGARLSENILSLRENSKFYRTAPGRFLLREMEHDPNIPQNLRKPIVARRRKRSLASKNALTMKRRIIVGAANQRGVVQTSAIVNFIEQGSFHYARSSRITHCDDVVVWAFILVIRSGHVLTYRQGHYREDRDTFMHKRTIGFYTPVVDKDMGLFELKDHGIVSSGVTAMAEDLDLQDKQLWDTLRTRSNLKSFLFSESEMSHDLLAVIAFSCPDWLDPTSKRLAINDLEWLDLRSPLNHHDDFDPWSAAILSEAKHLALESV